MPNLYSYRQRLGLIYARVVGYDLAAESPSLPTDYIAGALREVMAEHVAAGGNARGADEREVIQ